MPSPTVTAAAVPRPSSSAPASDRATLVARLSAAVRGSSDAAQVNAALADIVPGNDTSQGAFLRPQWVDELWSPLYQDLFLTNAVGQGVLTGMKIYGWTWTTRPQVGAYAGNKQPIPTNPVAIGPASADAYRIAGGWDIDRVFWDLGDGSMANAVLDMAAQDAADKMEAAVSSAILAAATPVPDPGTGVLGSIAAAVQSVILGGGRPTFIALASDLFAELFSLTGDEVPWWLGNGQGSMSLADGTANLPVGVQVGMTTGVPDGTVLAGDRRAFTHYSTGNIRVQALNIPNGGIDVGLFTYAADLVQAPAALAAVTVTP